MYEVSKIWMADLVDERISKESNAIFKLQNYITEWKNLEPSL